MVLIIVLIICIVLILLGVSTILLDSKTGIYSGIGLIGVICGVALLITMPNSIITKEECLEEHISYELICTTADYTNKTKREVFNYFIVTSNAEMDIFDAVSYLDPSLTDEEVSAIIAISDLKQKTAEH